MVFSQPSTHRTIQLKASDAGLVPLEAGDRERLEVYVQAFVRDLTSIEHTTPYARAVIGPDVDDLIAISFTPEAAFEQSPGPSAGRRLSA